MDIGCVKVDVNTYKDGKGFLKPSIKVHPLHGEDDNCDVNCQPIDIVKYVRDRNMNILLKGAFLPSVAKIIDARIKRLEKLILSMQGFNSKHYFGTIISQHPNKPEYVVLEWPEPLFRFNEMFASASLTENTISDFCDYLDKNITNSLDIETIVQDFQLDQISADDMI